MNTGTMNSKKWIEVILFLYIHDSAIFISYYSSCDGMNYLL